MGQNTPSLEQYGQVFVGRVGQLDAFPIEQMLGMAQERLNARLDEIQVEYRAKWPPVTRSIGQRTRIDRL